MSTFQARIGGGTGTANFDLVDLPDGSKAIAHAALGADGNPIVPAQDASIQALVAAVTDGVAATQAFVTGHAMTIVDAFGANVVSTITPSTGVASTDAFGNPLS